MTWPGSEDGRRLGYRLTFDGWRPVRWRRVLTWLRWTFVWRPL